jgi:hypothetical protein
VKKSNIYLDSGLKGLGKKTGEARELRAAACVANQGAAVCRLKSVQI